MKIETQTHLVHVIELTDGEVDELIASPAAVQAMLAKIRPSLLLSPAQKARIVKRVQAVRVKAEKKNKRTVVARLAPELFACRKPGCGREFKKAGFRDRHEDTCTAGQGETG